MTDKDRETFWALVRAKLTRPDGGPLECLQLASHLLILCASGPEQGWPAAQLGPRDQLAAEIAKGTLEALGATAETLTQ